MAKAFDAVVTIAGKIDPSLEKSIKQAEKSYSGLGAKIKTAAKVGMAGVALLGTATVAMGAQMVNADVDYKQAFAKTQTLLTGTAEDMKDYSQEIIGLSNDTGIVATELTDTVYNAISAGVDQNKAVEFSGKAAKLAAGGFTEATTAVDVLTTALNAYGLSADNAGQISDYLITTQNLGKTTVDELAQSVGKVIPIASAYGVEMDNLSAAYAQLTAGGIATAETGTYLKAMLNELGDSGSTVSGILMQETGQSFAQLTADGKSLGDVMAILGESVDGDAGKFNELWSSSQAGVGALSLLNGGAEAYNETLKAMQESAGATEKAYDTVTDTFEHHAEKIKNLKDNFLISGGEKLLPYVETALEGLIPVVEDGLDGLLEIVDVVAPVFGDAFSNGFNGILPIVQQVGPLLSEIVPVVMDVMGTVRGQIMTLLTQLGPPLLNLIQDLLPRISEIAEHIIPVIQDVAASVMPIIERIISSLTPLLDQIAVIIGQIIDIALPLFDTLWPLIDSLGGAIFDNAMAILDTVLPAISTILEALSPLLDLIGEIITNILPVLSVVIDIASSSIELLANAVNEHLSGIIDFLGIYIGEVINIVTGVISWLSSSIGGFIDFFFGIGETIGSIIGMIQDFNNSAVMFILNQFNNVKSFFGSFINFIRGSVLQPWISIFISIRDAVAGAFQGLADIVKTPMNAVVNVVNKAISGINSISVDIPSGVPLVGGKHIGFNIPTIPALAKGGFTEGVTIAGEAGPEAVISFDPKYKKQNLSYWAEAGRRLGLDDGYSTLLETGRQIITEAKLIIEKLEFNPIIYIQGSADKNDVKEAIDESEEEFFDKLDKWFDERFGGGDFDPEFI